MSTTKRTHRRTLSGKRVPIDAPVLPKWHEIVQPQPRHDRPERTGEFYRREFPTLTTSVEVADNYGGGRAFRRPRVYSNDLAIRLGLAWSRAVAAAHPQRRRRSREERAQREQLRQTERAA